MLLFLGCSFQNFDVFGRFRLKQNIFGGMVLFEDGFEGSLLNWNILGIFSQINW